MACTFGDLARKKVQHFLNFLFLHQHLITVGFELSETVHYLDSYALVALSTFCLEFARARFLILI